MRKPAHTHTHHTNAHTQTEVVYCLYTQRYIIQLKQDKIKISGAKVLD